jgi:hypothetical protein
MGGTHFPADDVAPELTADGEGDRRDKGKMEHGLGRSIPLPLPPFLPRFVLLGDRNPLGSVRTASSPPACRLARSLLRFRSFAWSAGLLPCLAGVRDSVAGRPSSKFRVAAPVLTRPFFFAVRRCEHYRRRCKIVAPCCKDVFPCRHCHNEATVRYSVCFASLTAVV